MARRAMAAVLTFLLVLGVVPAARADEAAAETPGVTPPRLSYVEGGVSFWRPGADDWAPAQVNTPLAPGDELYTAHEGNAELQVGARSFVRAWGDTQLGLANQDPDFLQVKVTTGHVAVDARDAEPGRTLELNTPHAALTIEQPGYYRVDVTPERTSFVARRGGRATVIPAGGQPLGIVDGQTIVADGATVRSLAAADLDVWDRWNFARSDAALASTSARYLPADVYGASELDRHGTWRTVETYGSVWVPRAVPVGWAPYSTGRWILDPVYGWTWVDTAPWGWAPYHYGRWVFVNDYWAWAPGPVVRRAVYAPALVVFFGAPGVRVSVGAPFVSWCALGWGEPVRPWWGRPGFVGRPWWGGWGGPRHTTVVNVTNVNVYRNVNVRNSVVVVRGDGFGRRAVHEARVRDVDVRQFRPVHGRLDVRPDAASFVAANGRAARPSDATLSRAVVATRGHGRRVATPAASSGNDPVRVSTPEPRLVPDPRGRERRDSNSGRDRRDDDVKRDLDAKRDSNPPRVREQRGGDVKRELDARRDANPPRVPDQRGGDVKRELDAKRDSNPPRVPEQRGGDVKREPDAKRDSNPPPVPDRRGGDLKRELDARRDSNPPRVPDVPRGGDVKRELDTKRDANPARVPDQRSGDPQRELNARPDGDPSRVPDPRRAGDVRAQATREPSVQPAPARQPAASPERARVVTPSPAQPAPAQRVVPAPSVRPSEASRPTPARASATPPRHDPAPAVSRQPAPAAPRGGGPARDNRASRDDRGGRDEKSGGRR